MEAALRLGPSATAAPTLHLLLPPALALGTKAMEAALRLGPSAAEGKFQARRRRQRLPLPLLASRLAPWPPSSAHRPATLRMHLPLPSRLRCTVGARPDAQGDRALAPPVHTSTRVSKKPNKQQHLWIRKETAGSGKKALRLIDAVSKLPNEREAIYGALDKWSAFEPEFPIIAAAKALGMLRRRRQWLRIIQVTKWLMSKGQVLTWTTYDTLLLALFMDKRVDKAESIWNSVTQTHTRSVPKRLFSRMILMYDICQRPDKVLEIYADMEELGVHPDEDTARRIGKAFVAFGQEEKEKHVLDKYLKKWKYIHFNGERVRVRRDGPLA